MGQCLISQFDPTSNSPQFRSIESNGVIYTKESTCEEIDLPRAAAMAARRSDLGFFFGKYVRSTMEL
jgi:hypothetical protein